MTSFSEPQKVAPIALVFIFGKSVRQILSQMWPIVLAFVFQLSRNNEEQDFIWLYAAPLLFFLPIISGFIRYYTYRWMVNKDAVIIRYGLFKKVELRIPFNRVQAIDIQEPWFYRPFEVVRFVIDTAGAKTSEADIWAIRPEVAEELRAYILSQKRERTEIETESDPHEKERIYVQLGAKDLLKIGLFRNHLKTIGAFVGGAFYLWSQAREVIDEPTIDNALSDAYSLLPKAMAVIVFLIILVLLATVFFSVIFTFVRYFNFRIAERKNVIRASYGLISRQTRQLRAEKVQIMRTERGPVYRKLGIVKFRIEQAHSGKENTQRNFNMPGGPVEMVDLLKERLFGKTPEIIHPGTSRRLIRFRVVRFSLFILILISPLIAFPEYKTGLWLLLLIPFQFLYSYLLWRGQGLGIDEKNLVTQRRIWFLKQSCIPLEKIQAVELESNWYQREHQLLSIRIETAGGSVRLAFLPETTATKLANYLLYRSEAGKKNWM